MATNNITRMPMAGADVPQSGAIISVADEGGLNLRNVLSILRRRKALILGIVFLVTSTAALFVNQITPIYSAQTQIVVEKDRQKVVNIDAVVQGLNPDYYTNETEAAVIRSRELAVRVVDRLDLLSNPLFNYELRPSQPSFFSAVKSTVKEWVRGLAPNLFDGLFGRPKDQKKKVVLSPEERRRLLREDVTASFLGGLSATPSDRSRIINVRFVSTDPKMSALAVNTVAETYIRLQLEVKGEATNRAAIWLNERVNELRLRVLDSQARLEEIRARSGVFQVGGASNMQRDLLDLNNQLMQARAKRAESDARHRQVQQILKAGGDIDSIAAVLDSQLIQRLREQEAVVLRKSGELKTQLRENHPRMLLADAELSDLRQKIAAEVNRIALGMGSDLQLAKVRETNLQIEVDALQKRLDDQAQAEAQVRTLESEVKTNTQLYETILQRFKETNVIDESTQQADARIINRATVPDQPFYPNKKMMIVAALIVSAVIGMALAFMLEFLDGGFRSLSQLEAQTGLPTLGLVPITDGKKRRSRRPHEIALDRPNSSYGEAIRSLRTGILLSNVDQPPRTVLITSSVPGEGKSSTSLSLAATSAKSGQRTIIIDCDLRHSSLHVYLDAPNQIGLSDFLAGQASLEDVIEIDPRSGVHYITAGGRTPNPTDLLASEEMKKLIRRLGQLYDLVVLDTPPLLAVSDALVLVRSVDKALFLVRWEKTRRETALAGIKQIVDSGADLAGIVLTQVDTKRHAQYDYSDSGYYHYGGYKKYYAE